MTQQSSAPNQFIRKIGLLVGTAGGSGIDLSQMQIEFSTQQADVGAPNTAVIRIFNLSDNTRNQIKNEFTSVSLQAGYEHGNYAQIFNGSIMEVRSGSLNATDNFVDIMASDGDLLHSFGFLNMSLAAGSSYAQQQQAIQSQAQKLGLTAPPPSGAPSNALAATGGILPRGKVLFGLAKKRLDNLAASQSATWSVQNGQLVFNSLTGYAPGEVVVLNSKTGMLGVPEATTQGITIKCLLNPNIQIGQRVQINNADINTTQQKNFGGLFPGYTDVNFFASTANDGIYRVLVVEHSGNIRGETWETCLICLALDQSAKLGASVAAY